MQKESWLISWVGEADHQCAEGKREGELGPIAMALQYHAHFDRVTLLTNYDYARSQAYCDWLEQQTGYRNIQLYAIDLDSPTHYAQIYEQVSAELKRYGLPREQVDLTFHLSPGTPAMAAVWIILAKTRFPAKLIQTSRQKGLEPVDFFFVLANDFLPEFLQRSSERIERLADAMPLQGPQFGRILHRSEVMRRQIELARKIAVHEVPALILGETGTGKELFAEAKAALQQAELPWRELQARLAAEPDIKLGLLDYYASLIPGIFEREIGASDLACMFLFREFARRPKRVNSLETMGLVQLHYPQLEKITTTPDGWPKDVESWRHYLKVLLDFYVRENTYIQIKPEFLSVIGNRFSPKWLRPPSWSEQVDRRTRIWPQVSTKGSQSRPVKLLMRAFGWSVDGQRDRMDGILRAAWDELVRCGLLRVGDGGFQLWLDDASFRVVSKAGVCPITRRLLDTAFEGLTPYTNPKNPDATCRVEWIEMPRYSYPFGDGAEDLKRIAQAREWLASEVRVQALRDEGLWSDLSDRIVEGGAYFRAAEHSAQQDRKKLERYEEAFKAGKLNLMSCSTTMEMGVDIGGISVVAMNNVPPHPANYLQRAGRAGRRREARAVALTVCKNTPHDQSVFDQPEWPFKARITVPYVSLQSPELVMRHVHAWLLSYWLKQVVKKDEIRKMTSGAFFIRDGEWSVAGRFVAWCRHPEVNLDDSLCNGLARLVKNTPLGAQKTEQLLLSTGENMAELAEAWLEQYQNVIQQRALFEGEKLTSKAFKALELQIERLEGEYSSGKRSIT